MRLFSEEGETPGTLHQILQESGYTGSGRTLREPKFVNTQLVSLPSR